MMVKPLEIESVLKSAAPARYDYFVKRVADRQVAWGLYADGWALAAASEGVSVFPIWPAKEYAQLSAVDDWSAFVPKEIDLDDMLEQLLPSLRERGALLGVFPTPNDKGVLPDIAVFERDVRNELGRLE